MKSTKYLYDCEAKDFEELPYFYAIEHKLNLAKKLERILIKKEEDFYKEGKKYDDLADLRARLKAVSGAVKFNQGLLDEINE